VCAGESVFPRGFAPGHFVLNSAADRCYQRLSARKEEVSAWRLLATAACLISLASCAPDHNYAAGPLAPTDITPEIGKARCRMMVEGRGGPGLVGLAAGDPFPIAAENRRKAQIDTCMVAQGCHRAD
jgi:hypothetical protein